MVEKEASGAMSTLVGHLFTGGPQDVVVAVLSVVILVCLVLGYQLYKRLMASELERVKQSEAFAESLRFLNKEYHEILRSHQDKYVQTLNDLNTSYQKTVQETRSESTDSVRDVTESLAALQVTIAELKLLISIISTRGLGNGTP